MTTWQEFARRAQVVPFRERGRGWDGWDCWGLIVCAYAEVIGVALPTYDGQYETTKNLRRLAEVARRGMTSDFVECDRVAGSIAGISRRFRTVHAGLVVDARHVMHCERGVGTVRQRDRELRIEGFWAPVGLSAEDLSRAA